MEEKTLVIDAHAHFVPRGVTRESSANISRKLPDVVLQRSSDIKCAIDLMDSAGIDMAVINLASRSYLGAEVCKAINDSYARVYREYPGRFIPCAHIFPNEVKVAIAEMERAIKGLGLQGLALPTSLPGLTLDSPEMWPIYEKVSKIEVPIVIHPIVRQPIWGGEKYRMSITISREYEIAKATCEIMYGILPHFPDLKFVMPHYGGGMSVLKGRVLTYHEPEGWSIPEDQIDVAKSQQRLKLLGLDKDFDRHFDKLYFDTAGYCEWMPIMNAAILSIKKNRLCFGTDYPFMLVAPEDIRTFIENIKGLELPEADKRLILGENIKALFKR